MTAADMLARGRAAARWRWTPAVLIAAIAVILTCSWNRERSARGELARHLEAEQLRAADLQVAGEKVYGDLWEEAERASAENEDLRDELGRARAAAPGARPVGVARLSTGAVVAGGDPRPAPSDGSAAAACLLVAGDAGEILVDEVLLETKAGNRVLVGAASAWRSTPAPRTRLFGGPFRAELGQLEVAKPPRPPGWGAGVWTGVGREGWAVGPAVAAPPLRLWRLEVDAAIGAGLGPSGAWQGGASAIARWR